MAITFMESGGSATQGLQWFTSIAGTVASDATVLAAGAPRSLKFTSGAAGAAANGQTVLACAAAGARISAYIQLTDLPVTNPIGLIGPTNPIGPVQVLFVGVTSGGVLRLYTGLFTQLGSDGPTLSTGTPYRISLSYSITNTTTFSVKVWVNGVLVISVTNTGTLAGTSGTTLIVGWRSSSSGNLKVAYAQHIYVDDSAAVTDLGDMRVTDKLPAAVNNDLFAAADGGTGAVNDRPLNEANYQLQTASGQVQQDYTLQAANVGDADLSNTVLIGCCAWIWSKISATTGSPTPAITFDGTPAAKLITLTTSPALYVHYVAQSTYPSNAQGIGIRSSGAAGDTYLYECGVLIAYRPIQTASLAGSQPAASATLASATIQARSAVGSQPAASATLARAQVLGRSLAGSQPTATGALSRLLATARALVGDQPAATGDLSRLQAAARALAGEQPSATGTLSRLQVSPRELTGDQPTATGDLSYDIDAGAINRTVTGDQPAATGTLSRAQILARSLAGDQPAATGALSRLKAAAAALAGDQPSSTGALSRAFAGGRALDGNQPAATGVISRLLATARALAGEQPSATGEATATQEVVINVAGSQPSASGTLATLKAAARALAGDQPSSTGTLARTGVFGRALAGDQPSSSGQLARAGVFGRILAGVQAAASGLLSLFVPSKRGSVGAGAALMTGVGIGAELLARSGAAADLLATGGAAAGLRNDVGTGISSDSVGAGVD